jgi:hydrogenase maturation protein HypF
VSNKIIGTKIWVTGIVQGVGFRPFVYAQAQRFNLTGWVRNTSSGVEIEANGTENGILGLIDALKNDSPPLARIDNIQAEPCEPNGFSDFNIYTSQPKPGEFIPISPDMAICEDCKRELFDPGNHRYRYPFINCTNCGPRFTIIKDIPYDRPKTTMAPFDMCPVCEAEYKDPLDRRFHAQPVACPKCGPHVWLENKGECLAKEDAAIQLAREWIKEGKIIAIKGLGGFHLACDATNEEAVNELRNRKKRSQKPFALMSFNLETIREFCDITPEEANQLQSQKSPIVLLNKKIGTEISDSTAPHQSRLGFMLPYTPLHLLLLEPAADYPKALVMTSGNLSEEPIVYEDEEAFMRLDGIADGYLMHNRPIYMRTDDSVVSIVDNHPHISRRARGYAPDTIQFAAKMKKILATGPELKNTFCLTREQYAFISHHIGDLENYETLKSFEKGIEHFQNLFRITPELIACDLHPNYLSTRYAEERAEKEQLPIIHIQHHHAHLASCLADNKWESDEPVIGLIFDGTGFGTDGRIWGGEVMIGNYNGYERFAHLDYTPLPGGEISIKRPYRMALSYLVQAGIDWQDLSPAQSLQQNELDILNAQIKRHFNTPLTSSMGRLFDGVSALIGVCSIASYEGQAAIEMEAIAAKNVEDYYLIPLHNSVFDLKPLFNAIVDDLEMGISAPVISAKFHNSLIQLSVNICQTIREQSNIKTVALSGGVWQNRYLLEKTISALSHMNFQVLRHHQVPTNDGGVSLGQALIAETLM